MGFVGDFVGDVFGGGDDAAKASRKAADIQADAQREALEYLKQTEELPQELREGALTKLNELYGQGYSDFLSGREDLLAQDLRESPLYQMIMETGDAGRERGEEAILRRAGATGGLRSGNVNRNLYEYNRDFETNLQNQALLSAYGDRMKGHGSQLSGLSGLADLPSNAQAISNQMSGIGSTLAQGRIGAAQAQQAGIGAGIGNLGGLLNVGSAIGGIGLSGGGTVGSAIMGGLGSLGAMFSDRRLKKNIEQIGKVRGLNVYQWEWNDDAAELGLTGHEIGFMADEIEEVYPEAVWENEGYKTIDYEMIGGM